MIGKLPTVPFKGDYHYEVKRTAEGDVTQRIGALNNKR